MFLNNMNSCSNTDLEDCKYEPTGINAQFGDDKRAICLHREYCQELRDLSDKYQRMYGPLSIYFPCNSWRWLEEQWPWERSEE